VAEVGTGVDLVEAVGAEDPEEVSVALAEVALVAVAPVVIGKLHETINSYILLGGIYRNDFSFPYCRCELS
jgi:hypothetical protein